MPHCCLKGPIKLLSMVDCARCSLDGFVIDYSPKPFVLGKVADFSIEDAYIDFDTQDDLGLKLTFILQTLLALGFPTAGIYVTTTFERFEQLADNKYRINIRKNTVDRMKKLTIGDEFILPYSLQPQRRRSLHPSLATMDLLSPTFAFTATRIWV